ncbi:MAG: chorismate synthase [Acutalibacteraceae bacterium]
MKNTFGSSIQLTIFGESHGEAIGAVLDGLAPGITVDEYEIAALLSKRRPSSSIDTARREQDDYRIVSGVFNGKTTGAPLCIIIPNEDRRNGDYDQMKQVARPSHADYTAYCKYHGYEDYRGGGHFSGRVTAALVACGAILQRALRDAGIEIGTHILVCGGAHDRNFNNIHEDIAYLREAPFPVLDPSCEKAISEAVLAAKKSCDSVGGIVQTAVTGVPAGVGEPWFDSVEGLLSHALFSLGGIKGVEFGAGFGAAGMTGSVFNDAFTCNDGEVVTLTNNNGGINGGITNGMPIVFSCAVKPTPSIAQPQQTVDFCEKKNVTLSIKGRHDPAIVRRICPVVDSITALVISDLMAQRYGTDVFLRGAEK